MPAPNNVTAGRVEIREQSAESRTQTAAWSDRIGHGSLGRHQSVLFRCEIGGFLTSAL